MCSLCYNTVVTVIHFRDYLRYNQAVKLADENHARSGERFYVMPAADCKLIVVDRKNFRIMKQKSYYTHKANVIDLIRESFYFTPYRDESRRISPDDAQRKLSEYYAWCNQCRKNRKANGKLLKLKTK